MKYIVQIRNTFDAAIETSLGPQNKPQFSFNEVNYHYLEYSTFHPLTVSYRKNAAP